MISMNGAISTSPPAECSERLGAMPALAEMKHHVCVEGEWKLVGCNALPACVAPEEGGGLFTSLSQQ